MARRRKGRAISGWAVVDKPAGPTSTAIVNKLRWAFDAQKAGHAGTLDPAATGVLVVALGEATKLVPVVTDALKAYRFTVRFGQSTDTDDAEGRLLETRDIRPADAQIVDALPGFEGDILQVPPRFSAVKVDGERAYARAREAEDFELASRPLFVESLTLVARPDPDHAELEMVCGKGGYVRAVARDLGLRLGCLGHVVALRRIWSGPFDADAALDLDIVEREARTEALDRFLRPLEDGLVDLAEARVSAEAAGRIANGNPAPVLTTDAEFGEEVWASHKGQALALGTYRAGEFAPSRVLRR